MTMQPKFRTAPPSLGTASLMLRAFCAGSSRGRLECRRCSRFARPSRKRPDRRRMGWTESPEEWHHLMPLEARAWCCRRSESSIVQISKTTRIYVAGHRGLVGSAVVRALKGRAMRICFCARTASST